MMNGLEYPGVLDALAHDTREDKLVLAMYERRPWTHGEPQLLQLQEKLNAYLSFILDGELESAFPQLADRRVEIQLRVAAEPSPEAWDLIRRVREQLAFQNIAFEVFALDEGEIPEAPAGPSGGGCCGGGGQCAGR
jgi:hypothetical protein